MARKRTYTDEQFINVVKKTYSIAQLLKELGLSFSGGNYIEAKKRLLKLNIDSSHFKGQKWAEGSHHKRNKKFPLEEVMIENSTYQRGTLKKRLLKKGILKNECSNCGQKGIWDNKELIMVLDHINGIKNDHRLENLRMLCPNCNSQQKTFCGRNCKKREIKKYYCEKCGKKITVNSKSGLCNKCVKQKYSCQKRKIKERPSKEQLLKEIKETNYCAVGRKYGVSDNAIRKWLK
jgi:Zn finger protein HypA/HybF involved in hydrogenase expression